MGDLDELLQSIRDEAKRESALTLYEGTRQDDLVDEEVDERILRLLGLEDTFDIDYATYLSLLKEKMVAARMAKQELPTEEAELLTDEFRRVKRKVGRFTIKKKKIKIDSDNLKAPSKPINSNKLLSPGKSKNLLSEGESEEKTKGKKISDDDRLTTIIGLVTSIRSILEEQLEFNKSIRDAERKNLENKKRKGNEGKSEEEKKATGFMKKLKKSAPKLGILDGIFNFLKNIIIGKAIVGMLEWMSDPDNKKKLENMGRFLKDWWPALTAAFLVFATPLGGFVKIVGSLVLGFTKILLKKILPKLLLMAKNPIALGLLGLGTLGFMAYQQSSDGTREEMEPYGGGVGYSEPFGALAFEEGGTVEKFNFLNPFTWMQGKPQDAIDKASKGEGKFDTSTPVGALLERRRRTEEALKMLRGYEQGGSITGPSGIDKVPAMLTAGEFVMSKGAVDKFGLDTMMSMNAMGGGTNLPKMIGGMTFAQGGGPIGPEMTERDHNALLAITSLEDTDPQGRADVAQALYNRLESATNYGTNYYQHERGGNDLFSLITSRAHRGASGGGQFEPTFSNPQDWYNITDRASAAIAVMNSKKGRAAGYTMEDAMRMLNNTEKAISDPKLQEKAAEHVGGRTFFFGTDQQGNMRTDLGDVLRNPKHDNFFTMHYEENTPYDKARRNIPALIPQRLRAKMPDKDSKTDSKLQAPPPAGKKEAEYMKFYRFIFDGFKSMFDYGKNLISEAGPGYRPIPGSDAAGNKERLGTDKKWDSHMKMWVPVIKRANVTPPMVAMNGGVMTLPPVTRHEGLPQMQNSMAPADPDFPTIAPLSSSVRSKKITTYSGDIG